MFILIKILGILAIAAIVGAVVGALQKKEENADEVTN